MTKETLMAVAAVCSLVTIAADGTKVNRGELRRQSQMRQLGGFVMNPSSYKGKIVFADATGSYSAEIEQVITGLTRQLRVNISAVKCEKPSLGNVSSLLSTMDASGVVFVTDDKALPPLLSAPESRWSIVNIADLKTNVSEDVIKRRIRCELARGYAYLAGAASSSYDNSVMTAITSPEQLDKVSDELPPLEVVARFQTYLERIGVKPMLMVPYRQACQEGWAPAPTNEYQKAIWDQVRGTPATPMKIEFDPKKGR